MRIIGLQLDIAWENKPANHEKVRQLVSKANLTGGELIVLPEMFSTGFSMNVPAITDSATQSDQNFLARLSKDHGVFITAGLVITGPDQRGCNQSVTYGPDGSQMSRYSKIHPYAPGKEAEHYTAGSELATFRWHDLTVSPFVCYDLRFPEIFRRATKNGAELLTVIASWPSARIEHWITLARARAIENQAYVVAINRCGSDPYLDYPGRSLIVDPKGNVLADAGSKEGFIDADIDADFLRAYRKELPFLADMRQDFVP